MEKILRAAMVAGLLAVGCSQAIQAQQAQRVVTFRAPFAFQVENTKLPAGEYVILEQAGWVQIQAKDGKGKMQVLTLPVASRNQQTAEGTEVIFHNYAGRFYLAQIWASGQDKGRELLESKEEQQLAKREKMAAVSVPATSASGK